MSNNQTAVLSDKEILQGNLLLLREHARRVVVQRDTTFATLEDLKCKLMEQYLEAGKSVKLTERDLTVLLYKGILNG